MEREPHLTPRRSTTRSKLVRAALLVLALLTLGFATTILVAVTIAWHTRAWYGFAGLFTPATKTWSRVAVHSSGIGRGSARIRVESHRFIGRCDVIMFYEFAPSFTQLSDSQSSLIEFTAPFDPEFAAPGAIRDELLFDPPDESSVVASHSIAVGWPLVSLYGKHEFRPTPTRRSVLDGVFFVTPKHTPLADLRPTPYWSLPYRPMWIGLIVNTQVYALLWFFLFKTLSMVVRSRRRTKGLCPHCRYDLRHTPPNAPCPECGTIIQSEARAQALATSTLDAQESRHPQGTIAPHSRTVE